MRPKSEPILTKGPSSKNTFGLAQTQCGYFPAKNNIRSAQYFPYSSLESDGPPIKKCILKLFSCNNLSITSRIRWTPFCLVTLPTKDSTGISFSNSEHLKYFVWRILLASKWLPGVFVWRICILYALLTPFGKENGFLYFQRTSERGDYFSRSTL